MDNHFTHVDAAGNARMVDVGEKAVTHRTAVAVGRVTMSPECFAAVAEGRAKKGDVLGVAQCGGHHGGEAHQRPHPYVPHPAADRQERSVDFNIYLEEHQRDRVRCAPLRCEGQTGVEMEALTGVSRGAADHLRYVQGH